MSNTNELSIIKTPYRKTKYTEEQIREVARCADPESGPQHFMSNYFFIQHPVKGALQYHPFEYQQRLIDSYHNYKIGRAHV